MEVSATLCVQSEPPIITMEEQVKDLNEGKEKTEVVETIVEVEVAITMSIVEEPLPKAIKKHIIATEKLHLCMMTLLHRALTREQEEALIVEVAEELTVEAEIVDQHSKCTAATIITMRNKEVVVPQISKPL